MKREMPSIMRKETAQEGYRAPFGDHPLLGHIAIYSINLILLRVIVAGGPFVFDESQIGTHEDGARPWDRLTHIWRSWFALDNLNGVTAVMLANRRGSEITVRAKEKFQVAESQNRLETCLNVAVSLGDNIASGLAGLLLFDPSKQHQTELRNIVGRLESEKIDLEFQIVVKRLICYERQGSDGNIQEFWQCAHQALRTALSNEKVEELEHICLSVRRAIQRISREGREQFSGRQRIEGFRDSVHPDMACEIGVRNGSAALLLYQAAKDIGDTEWQVRFRRGFVEFAFGRHDPREDIERKPEAVLAWIQLAREVGADGLLGRFSRDSFERGFHPRHMLEMSERNPEVALAWMQLAREVGGKGFLRRLGPEFIELALHPRHMLEMSERNPGAALAWMQLAREVGGEDFLKRLEPEFIERAFHPGHLLELSERNPEVAMAWIQLAREVGGEDFLKRLEPKFFERAFHPRHLLELSERNPEAALVWVKLAREVGGEDFLKHFEPEFVEQTFNPVALERLRSRKPAALTARLRLARGLDSRRAAKAVLECLMSATRHLGGDSGLFAGLPLSAIGDMQWLAAITRSSALRDALTTLVGDYPNDKATNYSIKKKVLRLFRPGEPS
jgi:hypothetical protein